MEMCECENQCLSDASKSGCRGFDFPCGRIEGFMGERTRLIGDWRGDKESKRGGGPPLTMMCDGRDWWDGLGWQKFVFTS
ncbi:hypothetical protein HPP92_007532 [Vanilla planifolia]|uniref:Uncharacterized protein n=1 Tax=Vanilla planifolia TaxID=51239 RepID=A0A835RGA0_VANPL|nr:hypothetical protein HPP92_007756 [Vanilla planifolia]KAG0490669.1 hypothetical protein HPP92_007532 [Vanilla planifolia]